MKVLSIFADESGYFNSYYKISPYYIVSLLFHDQTIDISLNIKRLNSSMSELEIEDHSIHTGPLIRRESTYKDMKAGHILRIPNVNNTIIPSNPG